MRDEDQSGGVAGTKAADVAAPGAPGRERRMTAQRKRDAALRVLRGEPLEVVARELRVTAADLSGWRDAPLGGRRGAPEVAPADDREARIAQLQAKLGAVTMEGELLCEKIARLEAGRPLAPRTPAR